MAPPTLHDSAEVIELVLSWGVATALTYGVVRLDERVMSEERLERAWPPSSRSAAIVVFGVLVLPIHFARTFGHFRSIRGVFGIPLGFVVGAIAVVGIAFVTNLVLIAAAWLLGLPLPTD